MSNRREGFNGASRRRSRSGLKESSVGVSEMEDGVNELRERVNNKKDRAVMSGRRHFDADQDEVADNSTDESVDDEQDEEEWTARGVNLKKPNNTKLQWKASNEMIGVAVPRKTRSACSKRLQSSSSPIRTGLTSVSLPTSASSLKAVKRMKPITLKTRPQKIAKYSISEREVEVAEVLYELTKLQAHHSPPKSEIHPKFLSIPDFKNNDASVSATPKASSPISNSASPSPLSQHMVSSFGTAMAPKRKKPRAVKLEYGASASIAAGSSIPSESIIHVSSTMPTSASFDIKVELENDSQNTKMEVLSPKAEKGIVPGPGSSTNPTCVFTESNLVAAEATSTTSSDQRKSYSGNNLDSSKMFSSVSVSVERVTETKLMIDLMALPENTRLDNDDAPKSSEKDVPHLSTPNPSMVTQTSSNRRMETEGNMGQNLIIQQVEENTQIKKLDEEMKLEKQHLKEANTESHFDGSKLELDVNKQRPKNKRKAERTAPPAGTITSSSVPIPVTLTGWRGSLPPVGYLGPTSANLSGFPSLQGAVPMEANSTIPNVPFMMPPQTRPKRCVNHFFIARLIHYQQQLARANPFWAAAGSAPIYTANPYNLNVMPQPEALMLGGAVIKNPALQLEKGLPPASVADFPGQSLREKTPNSFMDAQKKHLLLQQASQQGATLIFPVNQPRTGGTTKSENPSENGAKPLIPSSSNPATLNANLAATPSEAQYLTMLQAGYPFPIPPPPYNRGTQPSLHPQPPHQFFAGSFYPSRLLHLQPHPQPQNSPPDSIRNDAKPPLKSDDSATKKTNTPNFSSDLPIAQTFPIMSTNLAPKNHQQPNDAHHLQMSLKPRCTSSSISSTVDLASTIPVAMSISTPSGVGHTMMRTLPDSSQMKPSKAPDSGSTKMVSGKPVVYSGANAKLPASYSGHFPANSGWKMTPVSQSNQAPSISSKNQPIQQHQFLSSSDALVQQQLQNLYQKRQIAGPQVVCSGGLNGWKAVNQQVMTTSNGSASYVGGGGNGSKGKGNQVMYKSLGGNPVTVMATTTSYAQPAPNLPVRSAD
ncbi:hypothetical protein AMTR_s00066p00076200 [Amborella trichopoda]|uniref:Protein TIME FOR COFFEE n=1 Tax=Amborella trichopoda TaxID=13333 RepID=U5DC84_AMBTC|nr:hypothetical protein AMTR_s00066p00076200 [Amborella trichopoda]